MLSHHTAKCILFSVGPKALPRSWDAGRGAAQGVNTSLWAVTRADEVVLRATIASLTVDLDCAISEN